MRQLSRRPSRPRWALLAALLACALGACAGAPATGQARASANPFAHARFWVDPQSDAARQVARWARSRPRDAAQIRKIAREPSANWLGDWLPDVGSYLRWYLDTNIRPGDHTAFLAVYNLPRRDCSGRYSAGGARDSGAYRSWIDRVAAAIATTPAIVVVEPDGVPDIACLPARLRRERLALIAYATRKLDSLPATTVYIDAGRAGWREVATTARLLEGAGVAAARGFTLNVTGYNRTETERRYGHAISTRLGGKHFVINTSRNGRGPLPKRQIRTAEDYWCNLFGRALGPRPTTHTGDPALDAFAWVLRPGYSDGPCRGGPRAGAWWPDYALGLARRAAY